MKSRHTAIAVCVCVASGCTETPRERSDSGLVDLAPAGAGEVVLDLEARALVEEMLPRLEALAVTTNAWWAANGVDEAQGGFFGRIARDGTPEITAEKGLVQQSRHLWAASMWVERRDTDGSSQRVADHTYEFLTRNMADVSNGDFVYKVRSDGTEVTDSRKLLYANAFAVYGLSTYGRVTQDPHAVALAFDTFTAMEALHDPLFGGYDQTQEDGWLGAGAEKGTNTHIHLMEAYTALYRAEPDPLVGERLGELADLVAVELLQPEGYVHKEFERDFSPVGAAEVSYGHDLETAWLLLDAADVLDRSDDPILVDAARTMGVNSSDWGFDAVHGGFFHRGVPGESPEDLAKIWWVNFEALIGLWTVYTLTDDVVHLERMESTLTWLEEAQDPHHGEWFKETDESGEPGGSWGDEKGDLQKTNYHNLRALVFTADRMQTALDR